MKRATYFLLFVAGLAMPVAAQPASLLTEYWPMNSGDIRYYDGRAGRIYVQMESDFDGLGRYLFHLYEYDEEAHEYFPSIDASFGYSGDEMLEYGADLGWRSYSWDPPLPDLDENSLADGGTTTFHSVLNAPGQDYNTTVTITVASAGTVTVPAGTFHNCRLVTITARVAGQSKVVSAQAWVLAPKVGQIRIAVVNSAGARVGWEDLTSGTVGGVDVRDLANQVPPMLAITSPIVNQRLSNAVAVVRGTARDNASVSEVWFKVNSEAWQLAQTANGWTNWTASISLQAGMNSVHAYAVDANDNISSISSVRFVYDPFLAVTGAYNGLFHEENTVAHDSSGSFKAKVQAGGAFSASLQTGARRLAYTGRFGLDGKSTNIVARPGTNSLTVELCLKFDGSDEMVGRVTDGDWSASLMADRAVFGVGVNPATNFARRYTMRIPGSTNGAVEPAGDSVGSVAIAPGGAISFAGVLADGTPVTQSVPLSKSGDWPFYMPLYRGKGSILGWLHLLRSAESDIDGRVNWFRPTGSAPRVLTNGFILESEVSGSIYTPIGTNRALNVETARVEFTGGNLPSAFTNDVALGPNGRVTNASPNKLTVTLVRPTGLFNGVVKRPGSTAAIPFKGVLLQRQGYGSGFFLGTNESGHVYFGP